MKIFTKNHRGGFTLIELLVVVAIISLLSSIVLASLNGARAKARNARRASDLRTMQTALELYRSDHDGKIPTSSEWLCSDCPRYLNTSFFTSNFVNPKYISQWPTDPTPTPRVGTDYGYLYWGNAVNESDYILIVYGTIEGVSNIFPHGDVGLFNPNTWVLCSNPSWPALSYCR